MATARRTPGKSEGAAERRVQALALRVAGASYRAIGRQLGVSDVQALKDVQRSLADLAAQEMANAAELRTLELERLDMAQIAIAQAVRSGNLGAIDRWLHIGERRARLLGLDAPTKMSMDIDIDVTVLDDRELQDLRDGRALPPGRRRVRVAPPLEGETAS